MSNMHQVQMSFIKQHSKMADLIIENHFILLLLEHFEIDFTVNNKTVATICEENNINPDVFISIGNLYNGFIPSKILNPSFEDGLCIINVLKKTHQYYKQDKYPEILSYIKKLYQNNNSQEIKLIEQFFNEYFDEVVEHLEYEEKYAFPYFSSLLRNGDDTSSASKFSATTYQRRHTDIEPKLADLKNLLLKHLSIKNNLPLRRKLLFSLFELEFDLNKHSQIEENILIPLIQDIENTYNE